MNVLTKTTELAMEITLQYVKEGDYVVDATCGNGNDTLSLAKAVGPKGDVLALDIQREAIDASKKLMSEHDIKNVCFGQSNFTGMQKFSGFAFPDRAPSAIIFNLGYLPGGDKSITTRMEDSLVGIKEALELVAFDGVVTVVLYSGHEEGAREKDAILEFASMLPSDVFHVVYTKMMNQQNNPPEVLWITKKN